MTGWRVVSVEADEIVEFVIDAFCLELQAAKMAAIATSAGTWR